MLSFLTVRELFDLSRENNPLELDQIEYVQLEGWIKKIKNDSIELNDGSYFKSVKINFDVDFDASQLRLGQAISVVSKFEVVHFAKQRFSLNATTILVLADCDNSFEELSKDNRTTVRVKTDLYAALFKIRSSIMMSIHEFYQHQGFIYVNTPSMNNSLKQKLETESYIIAFRDVYSLQASVVDKSELWQQVTEIAFADIDDALDLLEELIKAIVVDVLDNCYLELDYLQNHVDNSLINDLRMIVNNDFVRLTSKNCKEEAIKNGFSDLTDEAKLFLSKNIYQTGLFILNSESNEFFIKDNDKKVNNAELVLFKSTSFKIFQEEENFESLKDRIDNQEYDWYLNLRKFGMINHAGFNFDIESLLLVICGFNDLNDVKILGGENVLSR